MKIEKTVVTKSGPAGTVYTYALAVTNVGAPFTGANVTMVTDIVPTGMTFTSATGAPDWTCGLATVPGGGTLTCTYIGSGPIATGASLGAITITATATGNGPFENCATVALTPASGLTDSNPANNRACVTSGSQDHTVDLAIEKTGGTSPVPQVNGYAFHLAITNVGSAFNGNNIITVTDVVPSGMTFNSATATNWTCATLPVSAGGTMTCTYSGAGPTAPNQPLGTINITATAMGSAPFPPFTNCANVGLSPTSGQDDINPLNNQACVTVAKPTVINACTPPMVAGPVAGQCICPTGTVKQGQRCAPPIVCRRPMTPNAAGTACACPAGMVQRGQTCVQPPVCRAPMIQNVAGTACTCPTGLVQRGRSCVQPTVCKPPAKLNSRGACQCPAGMIARGKACVTPEPQQEGIAPNDVIRALPGILGIISGIGGGGHNSPGLPRGK